MNDILIRQFQRPWIYPRATSFHSGVVLFCFFAAIPAGWPMKKLGFPNGQY
jgi:fucose permease